MAKKVIQRYNVVAAKAYETAQGEAKTNWVKLGTAVQFDDGSFIQNIDALPTGSWWDNTMHLFKQEDRVAAPPQQTIQPQPQGARIEPNGDFAVPTLDNDNPFPPF